MSAMQSNRTSPSSGEEISRLDEEMVELALLLPDWQAAALENAAFSRGLTTGQLARRIIQDFFGKFARPWDSEPSQGAWPSGRPAVQGVADSGGLGP